MARQLALEKVRGDFAYLSFGAAYKFGKYERKVEREVKKEEKKSG